MASTPDGEVAVPTTEAPAPTRCARMARPMPREAPVTRATSAFNASPRRTEKSATSASHARRRLAQGARIRHGQTVQTGRDAPRQSRQHLAGAALDHMRNPALAHGPNDLRPAHRTGGLACQRVTD